MISAHQDGGSLPDSPLEHFVISAVRWATSTP